ncbi:hypothetical protein Bbelb_069570 [Branchiostoma belcheri]|nr:hypothetical protein Bbelb_069570 [Branchiostoma belcheri]
MGSSISTRPCPSPISEWSSAVDPKTWLREGSVFESFFSRSFWRCFSQEGTVFSAAVAADIARATGVLGGRILHVLKRAERSRTTVKHEDGEDRWFYLPCPDVVKSAPGDPVEHLQHPKLLQLHLASLEHLEQLFAHMWRSSDSETMSCNTQPCCSCEWRDWSHWSVCSKTCGEGTMDRTRHRDSCCSPSSDSETMSCNTQPCCSCEWRDWSHWSACSRTCGEEGRQTRTRYREHCCNPSHQDDSRPCYNQRNCEEKRGVTGATSLSKGLVTPVAAVLGVFGIVVTGFLVLRRYYCPRNPNTAGVNISGSY